ncbi:MAG: hypothetical protein VYC17_01240 [Nitrospinota bacterium]|nr:hypothetical protein [Nitrospinota bacterium]
MQVKGYEIHMGITIYNSQYPSIFSTRNGKSLQHLGIATTQLLGTYLHGFFDEDPLRAEFLNCLRQSRGLPQVDTQSNYTAFRERQLDRLADMINDNIDMNKIHAIINAQ